MPETQTQIGAFNGTHTSADILLKKQRELNGANRVIQEVPEAILELSKKTEVYIYNVGPWAQNQLMGSLGSFHIPACPVGKEHSEPLVVPGLVIEHYPLRDGALDLLMGKGSDGWTVAQQIIGNGRHLAPGNSLTKYGVFASKTFPPSKEEIAKANAELDKHCISLVNEANAAMAQGPKAAEETIRPEQHFLAARRLRKTETECPWLNRATEVAERANCENCGTMYKVGIAQCPTCSYILDPVKYERNKKRLPQNRVAQG